MPLILNGSTGISGIDGSAGTPSYQGTDSNTGIFYPAADTIAFAEGGTEVMRIDSSGNVGIGTTAPGANLQVRGTNTLVANTRYLKGWIGGAGSWDTNSYEELGVGFSGIRSIYTGGTNWDLTFATGTSTQFTAGTQAERMRITGAGNVGIGTNSPSVRLQVSCSQGSSAFPVIVNNTSDTATSINGIHFPMSNGSSGAQMYIRSDVSGGDYTMTIANGQNQPIAFNTSSTTERMRITGAGNVGIGTNNPSATLQVVGNIISGNANGSGAIQVGSNSASQYQYINIGGNANGDNGWQIGKGDTSGAIAPSLGFYIYDLKNATSRMVIGTNGNVGIGTNAPSTTLYVNGSTYFSPALGSGHATNIIASYTYNNGTANTIGSGYQDQVTVLMIATAGVGYTALPIYCNAGGGIAYRWTYFDPDAGTWTYSAGSDIDVTFSNAGGSINTYRVIITSGGGSGTIQRTAGSAGYTVYVQRLIGA